MVRTAVLVLASRQNSKRLENQFGANILQSTYNKATAFRTKF